MIIAKNNIPSLLKYSFFFLITLFTLTAQANNGVPDTLRRPLTAAVAKTSGPKVISIPANVVFPEILSGNEDEALAYVEKFASSRRDYIMRMHTKGKTYFTKAEKILARYNVPQELKVLLALESAFNGNAVSPAGAVGYWQFMDAPAKQYGLRIAEKNLVEKASINAKIKSKNLKHIVVAKDKSKKPQPDDRKNFLRSTTAASRYLQDGNRNLNDWLLTVASYNCGIGNVWHAMDKTGKTNPTFWDVKPFLPAETRAYVMNFIAMNVVFHNYDKFLANTLTFRDIEIPVTEMNPTIITE